MKEKKYRIQDTTDGRVYEWTLAEILENINRDRSNEWTDYNKDDWQEGLEEFTEYTFIGEVKSSLTK